VFVEWAQVTRISTPHWPTFSSLPIIYTLTLKSQVNATHNMLDLFYPFSVNVKDNDAIERDTGQSQWDYLWPQWQTELCQQLEPCHDCVMTVSRLMGWYKFTLSCDCIFILQDVSCYNRQI